MLSQYEQIRNIIQDKSVNRISLPCYKAEAEVEAFVDVEAGLAGKKSGGNAQFVSPKTVGASRGTLFITLCRDASRRLAADGSFGFATRIIGDLNGERRIDHIMVNRRFQPGYEKIELTGNLFPEIKEKNIEAFNKGMMQCLQLKETIKKMDSRISYLKKKLKDSGRLSLDDPRGVLSYSPPDSDVQVIQDKDGNEIKRVPFSVPSYRLSAEVIALDFPKDDLIGMILLQKKYKSRYNFLSSLLRPWELGIIERNNSQEVQIGSVLYSIERGEDKRYDYDPEVQKKIESGEYQIVNRRSTRGEWNFKEKFLIQEVLKEKEISNLQI